MFHEVVQNADMREDILGRLPHAHPFQFSSYPELWPAAQQDGFLSVLFWENEQRVNLKAFALVRRQTLAPGLTRWLCYRGPVCGSLEDLGEVLGGLTEACRQNGGFHLSVSPYYIGADAVRAEEILRAHGFALSVIQGGHTRSIRVDLTPPLPDILGRFNENTRRQLRRGENLGLDVSPPRSPAEVAAFHGLYCEMSDRKGADPLGANYFQRFYNYSLKHPAYCTFLLARYQGEIVGGIMVLNNGHKSWYIHGASDARLREVPLTFLCHWRAMVRLKELGVAEYDFGGLGNEESKAAAVGINQFKRGFSKDETAATPEYDIVVRPFPHALYRAGRHLSRWIKSTAARPAAPNAAKTL